MIFFVDFSQSTYHLLIYHIELDILNVTRIITFYNCLVYPYIKCAI